MLGLSLGARVPNLKFVPLVILELLAFNPPKFNGSRDPGHDPFLKKFFRCHNGLSLRACMPNLKFVPLVVLELLAFKAQKFKGPRPLFEKIFQGSLRDFPWEHACQV